MRFRVKPSGADFVGQPIAGGGDLFERVGGGFSSIGLPEDMLPVLKRGLDGKEKYFLDNSSSFLTWCSYNWRVW